MFHTIITLAYTIPNIYLFLRIRKLFITKRQRHYYDLSYILIALIYPLSNLFSDADNSLAADIFTMAADYLLPFYLYLFLFVLAYDVILLINLLFKLLPKEITKSTRYKKFAFSILISLSLSTVVAGIINFNTIRNSEYRIDIPAKSSKTKNLRIAFVADFHLQAETNIHFVERFAKNISIINPDILLFGGDIVEGNSENEDMRKIESVLKEIKTKYGSFAVLGNHEHYSGEANGDFFHRAGIKVLIDTTIVIDQSFNLAGRNDAHFRGRKTIDALLRNRADSLPVILIDHRPTDLERVSSSAADVQFSGHIHNGQLFPINLITGRVYELSWGHLKKDNTDFFVTSGIRLWGPPVRTTGKSEIMVVDIAFAVHFGYR